MIKLRSLIKENLEIKELEIETSVSMGVPGIYIVGLPGKILEESAIRIWEILKTQFKEIPMYKVVINISPNNIRKNSYHLDLVIAVAVIVNLLKHKYKEKFIIDEKKLYKTLYIGELGLDGSVKKDANILPYFVKAREFDFDNVVAPMDDYTSFNRILGNNKNIFVVEKIQKLVEIGFEIDRLSNFEINSRYKKNIRINEIDFDDFVGGDLYKRAMLIAAAGRHNMFLYGPAGTGKTMLSKAYCSLIPRLTDSEVTDVSMVYSYLDLLEKQSLIEDRIVKYPHHSMSEISLIGGGRKLVPGEITLSHRGVIIMDEFHLYKKRVVESLREPLQENKVQLSKFNNKIVLPSDIQLIAISNLCPCGNLGSLKKICNCSHNDIKRYNKILSASIMDRIELLVFVNDEPHLVHNSRLTQEKLEKKLEIAINMQKSRYGSDLEYFNGKVSYKKFKQCNKIDNKIKNHLLKIAIDKGFSYRKQIQILRVARTIADLSGVENIELNHIEEGLFLYNDIDFLRYHELIKTL